MSSINTVSCLACCEALFGVYADASAQDCRPSLDADAFGIPGTESVIFELTVWDDGSGFRTRQVRFRGCPLMNAKRNRFCRTGSAQQQRHRAGQQRGGRFGAEKHIDGMQPRPRFEARELILRPDHR